MKKHRDSLAHIEHDEPGILPVGTLVLWSACAGAGLIGMIRIAHTLQVAPPPPVDALLLTVETTSEVPVVNSISRSEQTPAPQAMSPPAMPPPVALNPAIAFAEPEKTALRIAAPAPALPAVIHLNFGEGEGEQPAPQYPLEAVQAGEEGTVVVRMDVDPSGHVTDAVAISPSPWPLLNSAAVRAVRDTWRFRPGAVRSYEVSIQFQLNRHE